MTTHFDRADGERLAVLETHVEEIQKKQEAMLEEMRAGFTAQAKAIKSIETDLTRYRGIFGGVAFLVAAIVTAFNMIVGWLRGGGGGS